MKQARTFDIGINELATTWFAANGLKLAEDERDFIEPLGHFEGVFSTTAVFDGLKIVIRKAN